MKKIIIYTLVVFVVLSFAYQISCAKEKEGTSLGSEVGEKATDFVLMDAGGKNVRLKNFIGKEVVLLVFSTTWCPSCIREIPELKKFYDKYNKKGLKILGIYIQENQRKMASFVEKNSIPYTILLDLDGTVARRYKIQGVPTLIVIDKKGIIREKGFRIPGETLLEKLLKE